MSLLIKDVQVIDGGGGEPYKADVLVQRNVISAIGNLKGKRADRTIDGLGHYLVPGFIDVHTAADHYLGLFTNPRQPDYTNQGVTTIIGGHCGSSLAPLLYGTLESIRKWADTEEINVNWHTVRDFFKTLREFPLGVNFATLAGHSTIRRAIAGDRARLQSQELAVFKHILEQALGDGALGFSTGLAYVHGRCASKNELKNILEVVEKSNGVYTTHLRDESKNLLASVEEAVNLAEESGATTVISHFRPIKKFEKEFEEALKKIESSPSVYVSVHPQGAAIEPIYTLLPEWAQDKNLETMLERVRNAGTKPLIKKDMKNIDPDAIRIAFAPRHPYLIGKTVREAAENLGKGALDAILHLMDISNLRATVLHENINKKPLATLLTHERTLLTAYMTGLPRTNFFTPDEALTTFPQFIKRAVSDKVLTLPEAVRRITEKPARIFGIPKRGVVKEGNIADLTILGKSDYDIKRVILGGAIVGEEPHRGEALRHAV